MKGENNMTTITVTDTTPRAWVGCLGCYNSGALVGKWLDGENCADLESAGLADSAGKCIRCMSDEFWVMDHENYLGALKGECSPSEAQEIAESLASVEDDEREILSAWLSNGMDFDLDAMREAYIGEFASDEDMAQDYLDSTGALDGAPEFLARYFDLESFARDCMFDIFESNGHYFRSY